MVTYVRPGNATTSRLRGTGTDHSSARLERYLQLCGDDNIQVVNCTTPANYFHVLRRQLQREFRKPLIVMTPKSLLRNKLCVSSLSAMGTGTTFHRVMHDVVPLCSDESVARVIICSGKVYYDLLHERAKRKINNIFLLRLEQLYPFPKEALLTNLQDFQKPKLFGVRKSRKTWGRGLLLTGSWKRFLSS